MRKRVLITIIFAAVIGLSISGCDCQDPCKQGWPPDTLWVAIVGDTITAEVPVVGDTITAEAPSTSPWHATTGAMATITGWPPDTITVSFKCISNDLKIWEFVKINVSPETLGWPSDSVTSTKSFKKYLLNGTYDATK